MKKTTHCGIKNIILRPIEAFEYKYTFIKWAAAAHKRDYKWIILNLQDYLSFKVIHLAHVCICYIDVLVLFLQDFSSLHRSIIIESWVSILKFYEYFYNVKPKPARSNSISLFNENLLLKWNKMYLSMCL